MTTIPGASVPAGPVGPAGLKVLLPNTIQLSPATPPGVELVGYDVHEEIPAAHRDARVLVVWGNPPRRLAAAARHLPELRWVQSLAAGPDNVLAAGFAPEVVLTGGRGLHDLPVAEHTLALVLAAARRLDLATRAQVGHRWAGELGGLQPGDNRAGFTTLRDAEVVIWGFGSIAACLAPHLRALGARVTGIAQSAGSRAGFPVVTREALPEVLAKADVLVMILPAVPETHQILDAGVLSLLPPAAWVVNVGRGANVAEDDLVAALLAGRLAGAALDVTSEEPLPPGSPLWDAPNLILTPHAAGGRPLGSDELLSANLAAFLAGRPMRNLIRAGAAPAGRGPGPGR